MYFKTLLITATTAALLFSGCKDDRSTDLQDSLVGNTVDDKIAGYAVFNPDEGLIPYPNNILFAPNSSSTDDYDDGKTLNIPYETSDPDANIKRQLNTLTGFSTTSPITAPITGTLDPSTISGGVQLYKVNINESGAVTGITGTLQYGVDYFPTQSGNNIAILPLKPLESLSNYMVVLTNDLKDTQGRVLSPDIATALALSPNPLKPGGSLDAETAVALETIRQGNMAMLAALGLTPGDNNVVQIWNFRTQMIGAVQANIAAAAAAAPDAILALQDTSFTTKDVFNGAGMDTSGMAGSAEVYAGTLSNLPQYMPQGSAANPMPVLNGEFTYSAPFTPIVESNVTIPVVATFPNADSGCGAMPTEGWPVVIYQHGITRARTDLFVFGETLAAKCYAAVAIDLPLHGVTESNLSINPFYAGVIERTFNVDLVTESPYGTVAAYGPDGVIDSTGINFMNLANILTTRDNLQQTTSDLLQLQNAIASATGVKFDPSRISFLSHSLGNIASIGYLNKTDALQSAVLMMPGQQLIPFLTASPVFGPEINAGLAAYGIMPGTPEYDAFMLATQTTIDDADPANYTPQIGAKSLPILEILSVGDGSEGSGDQHIPYTVASSPLSGGKPFVQFTQAEDINTSGLVENVYPTGTDKTVTRLTAGEHRSALDPQYSPEATNEIHTELISFIDSNGTSIKVAYPSIIQQ